MWYYTVLSEKEKTLPETLAAALRACGNNVLLIGGSEKNNKPPASKYQIAIVAEDEEGSLRAYKPHIVIVPPMVIGESYAYRKSIPCRAAVIPGTHDIAGRIDAKYLVTYGMSSKDTVTMSSTKEVLMLAIQREIIDLNGAKTDIQEVPLRQRNIQNPESLMAAASVLLLSGVKAPQLYEVL